MFRTKEAAKAAPIVRCLADKPFEGLCGPGNNVRLPSPACWDCFRPGQEIDRSTRRVMWLIGKYLHRQLAVLLLLLRYCSQLAPPSLLEHPSRDPFICQPRHLNP